MFFFLILCLIIEGFKPGLFACVGSSLFYKFKSVIRTRTLLCLGVRACKLYSEFVDRLFKYRAVVHSLGDLLGLWLVYHLSS